MALASLEFKADNYPKYKEYLEKAFQLNPNHPLLLLHLAENSLINNDMEKARKLAIRGYMNLKRVPKFLLDEKVEKDDKNEKFRKCKNDFLQAKSRFLFIIAFYYHQRVRNIYDKMFLLN
jgi:hypothetical protein